MRRLRAPLFDADGTRHLSQHERRARRMRAEGMQNLRECAAVAGAIVPALFCRNTYWSAARRGSNYGNQLSQEDQSVALYVM
jgi:hypothetical protein